MRVIQKVVVSAFLVFSCAAVVADVPSQAQRAFQQGQELLKEGEFDRALSAFKSAARADRSDARFGQEYALLRQVIRLRGDLPTEKDPVRWMNGASALHTYYHEHQLYWESLLLDAERFRRDASAESAVLLARTQLALGMHSGTVELLGSLPETSHTAHTKALRALALSRVDNLDEAKKVVEGISGDDAPNTPEYFLDLARAQALVGGRDAALAAIKRALELTPPSRLEEQRKDVTKSQEFQALAGTPQFADALRTESTIKESPCSGGSGCSKCPERSKCGSAKTADKPEKS